LRALLVAVDELELVVAIGIGMARAIGKDTKLPGLVSDVP
jgi:hypothetical protein